MSFVERSSKIEQQKYDLSTVTAEDYTVELEISPKMYDDFLKNIYEPKVEMYDI